jgi:hypothetical protein
MYVVDEMLAVVRLNFTCPLILSKADGTSRVLPKPWGEIKYASVPSVYLRLIQSSPSAQFLVELTATKAKKRVMNILFITYNKCRFLLFITKF